MVAVVLRICFLCYRYVSTGWASFLGKPVMTCCYLWGILALLVGKVPETSNIFPGALGHVCI